MSVVGIVVIASAMLSYLSGDDCQKIKKPKAISSWMSVTLAEKYIVNSIHGTVVDVNGKPIAGAYIEIVRMSKDGGGRVIYTCETQESGKFQFKKIKSGEYEVRVSRRGHDTTSVRVTILKKSEPTPTKEIVIPVEVSS